MLELIAPALAAGFLLDLLVGDPEWFPHPVRLIGRYIAAMEKWLRRHVRRLRVAAVFLTVSTVALTMGVTALVLALLSRLGRWPLLLGMTVCCWLSLSVKCLAQEANGVRRALETGLEQGRRQVARIVGRDTASLSREEILRATIETVAENATDGVLSPMLFFALGGPVAAMGFKAASTLDSMVGYLNEKYRDIGWSSARLDDVLNFVPARLCAALLCAAAYLCGLDGANAARIVKRDHRNHKSPNCAWSEAAAAGALHIQLGGTHSYFGVPVEKPTIGDDGRPPETVDIARMNRMLYVAAALGCAAAVLVRTLFVIGFV